MKINKNAILLWINLILIILIFLLVWENANINKDCNDHYKEIREAYNEETVGQFQGEPKFNLYDFEGFNFTKK